MVLDVFEHFERTNVSEELKKACICLILRVLGFNTILQMTTAEVLNFWDSETASVQKMKVCVCAYRSRVVAGICLVVLCSFCHPSPRHNRSSNHLRYYNMQPGVHRG